jgi:opacity protein-like surface antigen
MTRLVGDESIYAYPDWRKQRNFAATTSVKELSVSVHWNVFGTNYTDVKYEPYVFAGAAASFLNVSRDYSRTNLGYFGETSDVQTGLVADIATPTPRVIPVAPVGAGVRYHISDRIVLNLEGSYRFMRTDHLDGFSRSANPTLNDHYSSLTIGASYKFGNKEKYGCPAVN